MNKKLTEINDLSNTDYKKENENNFKTSMFSWTWCDYAESFLDDSWSNVR